jgi:rubrerythrin
LSIWKAFVTVGSAYRKTILTLARDSQNHRLKLEKLFKTLNLETPTNEMHESDFDFTGKCDAEILQEVVEQDEIAQDLYAELAENTDPKLVATLSSNEVVDLFFGTLTQMAKDEERHIKMAQNLAGCVKRIQ